MESNPCTDLLDDEYTMNMRLCDDLGMVSYEPVHDDLPTAHTSYLDRLNGLRSMSGHSPYEGEPFACTGDAHLAHEHIRCTSSAHRFQPIHHNCPKCGNLVYSHFTTCVCPISAH